MSTATRDLQLGVITLAGILLVFSFYYFSQGIRAEIFQPLAYLALTILAVTIVVSLVLRRRHL